MPARTRVTLDGTVAGGSDIWTTSFFMDASSGYSLSALQQAADEIDSIWRSTVWTVSGTGYLDGFHSSTAYRATTVRDINAAGVTSRVVQAGPSAPINGTGVLPPLPSEVSMVVSLLTDTAGGRGRGRMYLPPMTADAVDGSGLIASLAVTAVLDAMEAFFEGLNASTLVPNDVSVYSGVDDVLREVSSIRIGNVWDAQRRRRNGIVETYQNRVITH